MRPTVLTPLTLLGALAVLATTAGAAAAPKPVASSDPKGDVRSPLDLTRVSLARSSDGRLRASLTLAGEWDADQLRASSGPPGSVCLKLWTTSAAPDMPPDVLVCTTADKDGNLRGSVLKERANKLPVRVAGADVSRPTGRTVTLRFSQTAIGRPAKLTFAAETTRAGCPRVSCIDTAPDAPKTLELLLRSAG
jgi:hypothetical protein